MGNILDLEIWHTHMSKIKRAKLAWLKYGKEEYANNGDVGVVKVW